MNDEAAVRGLTPKIQSHKIDVLLLNIHTEPTKGLLKRFEFVASPTYLIYDADGIIIFRSNRLPTLDDIFSQVDGNL